MEPVRRLEEARKQLSIVLEERVPEAVRPELEAAKAQVTAVIDELSGSDAD